MPVPTARLAVAAAVASLLVLAVAVAGGGPAGPSTWPCWWRRSSTGPGPPRPSTIPVERDLPGVVPLGGEAEVRVDGSRNPGRRRPCGCRWPTSWRRRCAPTSRRARVVVPPGGRATARTDPPPPAAGPVHARPRSCCGSRARWRLAARQGRLRVPGVPAGVPAVPVPGGGRAAHQPGPHPRDRPAVGAGAGRRHRVRPAPGVHASTTSSAASTGRPPPGSASPIVRTYRAERNQTVLLLLDSGRMMAGRVAGVPRLDHAMDAVMMLTAVATRLGDRCGLVAFDQEVRAVVPPRAGPRPARPGHRGHVRPRAGAGRERLPGRLRRRPWAGSAAGRCSSCSPSWPSRR